MYCVRGTVIDGVWGMLFLVVETSTLPLAPGPEIATITFSFHLDTTV